MLGVRETCCGAGGSAGHSCRQRRPAEGSGLGGHPFGVIPALLSEHRGIFLAAQVRHVHPRAPTPVGPARISHQARRAATSTPPSLAGPQHGSSAPVGIPLGSIVPSASGLGHARTDPASGAPREAKSESAAHLPAPPLPPSAAGCGPCSTRQTRTPQLHQPVGHRLVADRDCEVEWRDTVATSTKALTVHSTL